ncbi:MAG TPA: hypothetical protein VMW32_03665 [Bacteroidales bacterium]|nr:hypothetical protein [Bacteroidales bacterium]
MTTEEYLKINELIGEFENGKQLYRQSPIFNRVIQMIARGVSKNEVIETLIKITEDTNKAFEHYMIRDTRPYLYKPPE